MRNIEIRLIVISDFTNIQVTEQSGAVRYVGLVAAERRTEHCSSGDVYSHVIHDYLVEKTKNPERSQIIGLRGVILLV